MSDTEIVKNAVRCTICGAAADLINWGSLYVCQSNPSHMGDIWVGIFTDLSYEPKTKKLRTK